MDSSLAQIQTLHPKIRQAALDAYSESVKETPVGVHPVITQGLRSFAESDKLYAQGRTTPGSIVSNAKAGQSWHNYGLALDFVNLVNGKENWNVDSNWMKVVNIFKSHGFTWGGDFPGSFKDYPHFEMKLGLTLSQVLAKYNNKDFIEGTNYINI
jgi:peptidoglycan L-alanyl-D-glutamate endopeptidase CwlK